jgi:hypothetical protein
LAVQELRFGYAAESADDGGTWTPLQQMAARRMGSDRAPSSRY